jgi:hypothetical protein
MSGSFFALKRAMGVTGATGQEPSWGEVMGELWPVISSPLSSDGERLLLDVIHHHGRLRLTETAELPHSLPPDEMLKSLAVQALARWTRLTYLTELQRLELTASSPALQSTVRAVIQTAQAARPQEAEADVIAEEEPAVDEAGEEMMWSVPAYPLPSPGPTPSVPPRRLVARPVGRFGNWTLISGGRPRKCRRKEEPEPVG